MANPWPIGIFTSVGAGLGLPLATASELGITTIHLHAPHRGSRSPDQAKELAARITESEISVSCLFAGFDGESYEDIPTVERTVGLVNPATRSARHSELKEISDFGSLLAVPAVGLHVGFVPHDTASKSYADLIAVMRDVCDHCATNQQSVYLETGQETAAALLTFLSDIDRSNLFVNFDPANMILYGVGEPLPALEVLGSFVRSVHCKDARWSDQPGVTWGTEMPLGEGDVDVRAYLTTLKKIGYDGPLTIEREIPQDPERQRREIGAAVSLLEELKQDLIH
ncbi:MAG: sugar phosphate isomerase/epimerase family protein [Planctomycetota bacterium]